MTDENQNLTPASESPAEMSPVNEAPGEQFVFTPPIDIYENENGLVLHADLPGVSSETLELQVQDNKLTLFGHVKPDIPESAKLLHKEYEVGSYLRSFILSDQVDYDNISANLNDGVLKVVLPRTPQSEARRIPISTD